MIGDPEATLDHGPDPRQRPTFGLEAGLLRSFGQDVEESLPLRGGQSGRPTRFGSSPQGGGSLRVVGQPRGPLADGHAADAQSARDLGLGEPAGAEQPSRFEPTLFELLGSEFLWSPHAYDRTPERENL
jgi:hypothetical protein